MAVARKTVNNGNSNFMASVMATEDNTNVTVAGFKPGTVFSATPPSIVGNSFTFTLNKGQSYIIDGISYEYQNKLNIRNLS